MINNVGVALIDSVKNLQKRIRVDGIGDSGRSLQLLRYAISVSEINESQGELLRQLRERRLLLQQVLARRV